MITQKELKHRLNYIPDTGVFTWRDIKGSRRANKIAGSINNNGYRIITIDNIGYRAHRIAWLYVYGNLPLNQIDHINGIKTDNKIGNLRDVTQNENSKNSKIGCNNTSGFKGVEWIPSRNKWRALISSNRKKINVGSHSCKLDAIAAVMRARKEYGFHENHGRV